nr:hypothetical protein [Tanacetum cinerariifolium]
MWGCYRLVSRAKVIENQASPPLSPANTVDTYLEDPEEDPVNYLSDKGDDDDEPFEDDADDEDEEEASEEKEDDEE